jgi:hypothetical protein
MVPPVRPPPGRPAAMRGKAPSSRPLLRLAPGTAEIVFTTTEPGREAEIRRDLDQLLLAHFEAEAYLRRRRGGMLRRLDRARFMQWIMWGAGLLLGIAIGKGWV